MKTLRSKVKERMQDLGIDTPALAKKVSCHHMTIYLWIWGRRSMNSDLLERVLKELKFEVE